MLLAIFFLTSFAFAVVHPLLFWTTRSVTLKNTFYQFNLALCCFAGSFSTLGLYYTHGFSVEFTRELFLWWLSLMIVSAANWNRDKVNLILISLPSCLGFLLLLPLSQTLFHSSPQVGLLTLLAGLIFSTSLYSGILGHWYIEMKHLSISHLNKVTNIFGCLLFVRLCLDIFVIFEKNVLVEGDWVSLSQYILMGDGFLLWVALLFGTVFPFILIFFVRGTLKEGSHTSATGILYVIFISVMIGDLTYKYYWAKSSLFL